jgi:hypothetical protein
MSIWISALFAGFVAIAACMAIEKFGGRLGGLLGSAPTTIVPASLGFWWSAATPDIARDALFAVPPGMMVTALFLYCWRVIPPRLPAGSVGMRLLLMTCASLGIWGLAATGLILTMDQNLIPMFTFGSLFFAGQIAFGLWACLGNPPAPQGQHSVSPIILLARGLLAAGAIGLAVWFASLGIPLVAGVASVFPAIFLTTMLTVWLAQGQAVQAGAVGPMMLGSASVSAYCLIAAWTMGALGPEWGAIIAWLLSVALISWPAWWWLDRRAHGNAQFKPRF